MVGRTIVFQNFAVADGGGTVNIAIPSGVRIRNVTVVPQTNACPRTTTRVKLRSTNDDSVNFILPYGVCHSILNTAAPYTWFGDVPLDKNYEWEINLTLHNRSGGSLNFSCSATFDVPEKGIMKD